MTGANPHAPYPQTWRRDQDSEREARVDAAEWDDKVDGDCRADGRGDDRSNVHDQQGDGGFSQRHIKTPFRAVSVLGPYNSNFRS